MKWTLYRITRISLYTHGDPSDYRLVVKAAKISIRYCSSPVRPKTIFLYLRVYASQLSSLTAVDERAIRIQGYH